MNTSLRSNTQTNTKHEMGRKIENENHCGVEIQYTKTRLYMDIRLYMNRRLMSFPKTSLLMTSWCKLQGLMMSYGPTDPDIYY